MAFRLIKSAGSVQDSAMEEVQGSGAISIGDVVKIWVSTLHVIRGEQMSQSLQVSNIYGISQSSLSSGTGWINVIPILPGQRWEADCASNTASTHTLIRHAVSRLSNTLVNTTTSVNDTLGVFLAWSVKGAAADKKLIGEFIRVIQGTN